jgi:methionyl-tRNA formyltransferase
LRAFANAAQVVAAVTQPARPSGRGKRVQPTAVHVEAAALGIPVWSPERIREIIEPLRALHVDVFAVASYGKILPQELLDIPGRGALNVHPSLLPLYRGATPLQAQIRDMCATTGVTIIAMDAGMDTGDILVQHATPLGERETYGELEARLAALGADALIEALALVESDRLDPRKQSELASAQDIAATLTRPLRNEDLRIDWTDSARRVDAFVRSLSPQPGARGEIEGEPCKIVEVHPVAVDAAAAPGMALRVARGIAIACGDGAVAIDRLIPPNRAAMSGEAFAASFFARTQ